MKKFLSLIAMSLIVLCLGMVTFASPRMAPCPESEDGSLCNPTEMEMWFRDGCYEVFADVSACEYCKEIFIVFDVITAVGYYHNWLPNGFCSECGIYFK